MNTPILYLTPYPPTRSGIADYAATFKQAIEGSTHWRMRVANRPTDAEGNKLIDIFKVYHLVSTWQRSGMLQHMRLVHAEIGYKQHIEFLTLLWLHYLAPHLPSVVTIHDPPLMIAPTLYPFSMGLRAPIVRRALRTLDYTPLGRGVIKSVLRNTTRILVLSEGGRQALRNHFPTYLQIEYVPHLTIRKQVPHPRDQLGGQQPVTILFMGYWSPTKGLEVLLRAFEQVYRQANCPVRLWLAGGVEESGANRAFVEKIQAHVRQSAACAAITLLGYVPEAQIDAVLHTTDIFVLPYLQSPGKSASGALIRAMQANLAIVASAVGVLPEEIRHNETGLLVIPGDHQSLTNALKKLIKDASLRQRLALAAQRHVSVEHSWSYVGTLVGEIYDRCDQSHT